MHPHNKTRHVSSSMQTVFATSGSSQRDAFQFVLSFVGMETHSCFHPSHISPEKLRDGLGHNKTIPDEYLS